MQGRVIGAAGPLHPCIPCIELYYQRYSHHFHSSEGLTSSFLLLDRLPISYISRVYNFRALTLTYDDARRTTGYRRGAWNFYAAL